MGRPEISGKENRMLPDQRGEAVYAIQQNIFTALSHNPSYLAALHKQFISPSQPKTSSLLGTSVSFMTPNGQEITIAQKVGARKTNGLLIATRRLKATVQGIGADGTDSFSLTVRYAVGDNLTFEPASFLEGEIAYMRNGSPVFSGRANDLSVEESTQKLAPILNPDGQERELAPEEIGREAFALQERLVQITKAFPEDRRDGFGKSFGSHVPTAQIGDHHGSIWLTPADRVQIEYTLDRLMPNTVDNLAFSRVLIITFSTFGLDSTVDNKEAIVLTSGYQLDPMTHEVIGFTNGEFAVWNMSYDGGATPRTDQSTVNKVYKILNPVLASQIGEHPQEIPAR